MKDEIKNIFLAGLGSAAYTYEKASKLIEDMVQKGKITVNEGKELSEELKRTVNNKSECKNDSLTKEDMRELLNEMNFVKKEDINTVNTKLENLEKRLNDLENKTK